MNSMGRVTVLVVFACLVNAAIASAGDYTIGDEDVLQISVWGNQELNVQVPVRPDGMISVPLAGDIRASGSTTRELKAVIERELVKYIKNPTVTVIVIAVNSFKVYVLGDGITAAGTSNGVITLRRNTSLMQLLAQFGSLKNADLANAYVLRDGIRLPVDFKALIMKGDVSHDIALRPNDIIYVPDAFERRISVVGAVKTPGVLNFRDGMTALDAVLNSGGFTEFAKQNDVMIVRKSKGETRNIDVRLRDVVRDGDISKDVPLMPGDLVVVKTGIF